MEHYNKIIEALHVRFVKARNVSILKPVKVENNHEVENYLVLVKNGEIRFGKEREWARQGDLVFIPGGRPVSISYGSGRPVEVLSKDDFLSNKEKFLKSFNGEPLTEEHYSYVSFDVKAFDAVNFFYSLDIPPFKLGENHKLVSLIMSINDENLGNMPGKERIINVFTENMAIELIRYILNNSLFVEKLATNVTYFRYWRGWRIFLKIM